MIVLIGDSSDDQEEEEEEEREQEEEKESEMESESEWTVWVEAPTLEDVEEEERARARFKSKGKGRERLERMQPVAPPPPPPLPPAASSSKLVAPSQPIYIVISNSDVADDDVEDQLMKDVDDEKEHLPQTEEEQAEQERKLDELQGVREEARRRQLARDALLVLEKERGTLHNAFYTGSLSSLQDAGHQSGKAPSNGSRSSKDAPHPYERRPTSMSTTGRPSRLESVDPLDSFVALDRIDFGRPGGPDSASIRASLQNGQPSAVVGPSSRSSPPPPPPHSATPSHFYPPPPPHTHLQKQPFLSRMSYGPKPPNGSQQSNLPKPLFSRGPAPIACQTLFSRSAPPPPIPPMPYFSNGFAPTGFLPSQHHSSPLAPGSLHHYQPPPQPRPPNAAASSSSLFRTNLLQTSNLYLPLPAASGSGTGSGHQQLEVVEGLNAFVQAADFFKQSALVQQVGRFALGSTPEESKTIRRAVTNQIAKIKNVSCCPVSLASSLSSAMLTP